MDFRLTEENKDMVDVFKEFGEKVLEPWGARAEQGEHPNEAIQEMANAGFVGMVAPEEYGGSASSYLELALAMETFAKYSPAIAEHLNMSNCNLILPLLKYGTEEQKRAWIPRIVSGEAYVAFALTEPEAGSDNSGMKMKAVADGDVYVLNGQKSFITGAKEANVYMVFAVTGENHGKSEISAFMLDRAVSGSGVSVGPAEETLGMNGAPAYSVYFDDVRIPKENIIGGLGGGMKCAMCGLNPGRCALSALAIGIAQHAIDETVKHVKERKMFGKTLADFQNTQFVLADMQTRLDAARLLVHKAAVTLDQNGDAAQISAEAKLFATETSKVVVDACLQFFGGYGYTKGYAIEQMYRDIRVFTIFEGASEVQKHVIAKCMGIR